MMLPKLSALAATLLLVVGGASAFSPNSIQQRASLKTELAMGNTVDPPKLPPPRDISYGEESRKYRRTIFTHDDWVNFRSPDRFWRNLNAVTSSGIYKSVGKEILATVGVATFVILYNGVAGGFDGLDGTKMDPIAPFLPVIGLPLAPFTLSSPSLGLLLVFRTNTSYKRWDEARKNWGMNINHTRDLVRLANAYYDREGVSDERREQDLKNVALATWSFVRAMKRHLSPEKEDEEDFKRELYERLPAVQAEAIINAAHRPNRALFDLSLAIENLPMHFLRKNEIHQAVTIFEDNLGSSERLLTSPVPLFYSRHTARFLGFWLLLLPLGLYQPLASSWNHLAVIPVTFTLSLFLFGIEELATQLEEPFTVLPMQAYSERIGNWCNEIVTFKPGDNGVYQQNVPGAPYPTGYGEGEAEALQAATTNGSSPNGQVDKFSEPVSGANGASRLRSLISE
ncbi:UPF0187 protein [Seminavis robusta]|uniref:UPF0187 protein n=1 Tax=Seminavis robusta TaxID=568900 RepID=A0A9N8HTI9_9STRA|nr:UPF0187 protein [Seminavis robusta]|eukprot:Sro1890_g303730.1 UPF0187 protein (455) ;mRNA; r:15710-17261